jgi:hypothetical protein
MLEDLGMKPMKQPPASTRKRPPAATAKSTKTSRSGNSEHSGTLTAADISALRAEMADCRREMQAHEERMQAREERISQQVTALQQILDTFAADYLITAKEMNVSRRHIVTAVIIAQLVLAENSEAMQLLLDRLQDLYHPGTRPKTPRIHYGTVWYKLLVEAGYPADEVDAIADEFLHQTGRLTRMPVRGTWPLSGSSRVPDQQPARLTRT